MAYDSSDPDPSNPNANGGSTDDGLLRFAKGIAGYALGAAANSLGTQKETTQAAAGADAVAAKTAAASDPKRIFLIVGAVVVAAFVLVKVLKK